LGRGEDVEKIQGCYPPLVWVDTAIGTDARVTVASAPEPTSRVRGSQGCHRFGHSAVGVAPPDDAETGVDVQ